MGMAKLNVWIRDEDCKIVENQNVSESWDWVEVRYVAKSDPGLHWTNDPNVVAHVTLPQGKAHVDIEVPPGMYVVAGHICAPDRAFNNDTDKAIVVAKCNETVSVDLIIPSVSTCAWNFVGPFVYEAVRRGVPDFQIQSTVQNIIAISDVSVQVARNSIATALKESGITNTADSRFREFNGLLKTLKKIR